MSEITVSWDASATPGASYDLFRGTTPGHESATPYVTGIVQDAPSALTSVAASIGGNAAYAGTIFNGVGNFLEGMKVTIAGFANASNNGVFTVVTSTAAEVVVANPAAVAETASATFLPRPYYIDTAVLPGQIYVYKVDAVVNGVHSLESVEVISEAVPFGFSPLALGLGNAATSFEVLGGSAITNTGPSAITGEIGVWPGTSITGFGAPAIINGGIHTGDFVAQQAQSDLTTAFNSGMALSSSGTLSGDIGGQTLLPGVYTVASSLAITGSLNLDAGGNIDAVWVFQIGSTLTTAVNNSDIILLNGAQAKNVFWIVGSSATLTGGSSFVGNILAQVSITVGSNVNVNGRLLARTGAVTLINDTVSMQFSSRLTTYAANAAYALGDIIFDCGTNSWQQVVRAGTTGATRPPFSAVFGTLTLDGTVIWESLDSVGVVVLTGLPPAPANVPPPPPAAPTNPAISSEN